MIEFVKGFHQVEIIGYLFQTIGIVLLVLSIRAIIVGNSKHKWNKTIGEVLSAELNTGELEASYSPKVKYRYSVKGKEYTATSVFFGNNAASSFKKRKSQKILKDFPKGAKVQVYYNPAKEHFSVLDPRVKYEPVSLVLFAIAFIIGGYLINHNLDFILAIIDNS